VLKQHDVRYILIGALAARLYGFPRLTADADITPQDDPANVARLAKALIELNAKIYTDSIPEGLEFDCSPAMLARARLWNLVTSAGRIDIAFNPGSPSPPSTPGCARNCCGSARPAHRPTPATGCTASP
jgi:hypothetical protein